MPSYLLVVGDFSSLAIIRGAWRGHGPPAENYFLRNLGERL